MAYYLFIVGKTVQVVNAGEIDQFDDMAAKQHFGAHQVNCDARPVTDPRRGTAHAIEQGGLAGIRHAQQSDAFHYRRVLLMIWMRVASERRRMISVVPIRTCSGPRKRARRTSSMRLPMRKPSAVRRWYRPSSASMARMVACSPGFRLVRLTDGVYTI